MGPTNIISSLSWTTVISGGKERQSNSLQTELWHTARELINPWRQAVKVYFWCCQQEGNCFQWSLLIGMEKKSLFQISDYTPGTRGCANLLKQGNHIWNSSCSWSHHLVKFVMIHCSSLGTVCFLHRFNKWVEWGCGGNHHFCLLQVCGAAANLCNTSRNAVQNLGYFYVNLILVASTWPFLPCFIGHRNNVVIQPVAEYLYLNYAFWKHYAFWKQ